MSTLSEAVGTFLDWGKNNTCTPRTLQRYQSELRIWQEWRKEQQLPDTLITIMAEELQRFLAYLQFDRVPHGTNPVRPAVAHTGLSANSCDGYYRTLHAFITWCIKRDLIPERCIEFACIPRPKIEQAPRPTYNQDAIDCLLTACEDGSPEASFRNKAIIFMLLESGMRVSELCQVTDEAVDLKRRRARIRGKGGKYRYIFWFNQTAEALRHYLDYRRGGKGGAFFRSLNREQPTPLTASGIRCLFRRLSQRFGVHLAEGAPIHAL